MANSRASLLAAELGKKVKLSDFLFRGSRRLNKLHWGKLRQKLEPAATQQKKTIINLFLHNRLRASLRVTGWYLKKEKYEV